MPVRSSIVVRTNPREMYGSAGYEHEVAEVLKERHDVRIWQTRPAEPGWLRFKKLRYLHQNLTEKVTGDLLITNSELFFCGLPLGRFRKKILLLHHVDTRDTPRPWIQSCVNWYLLKSLGRFDKIVVLAQFWKDFLSNYTERDRIEVIEPCFDVPRIKAALNGFDKDEFKRRLQLPPGKILVYAGLGGSGKGAAELVRQLNPNRFHVITTGRGVETNSHQHFQLNYADYCRLLSVMDVGVMIPSFLEGWSRSAHEVVLCGTPLIGVHSGGLGELIDRLKQTVCSPHDKIEDVIESVIARRDSLVQTGRPLAEEFSMERFRDRWTNLAKAVLG